MLALLRLPCSRCTHYVVEAGLGLSRLPSNGPTHKVIAAVFGLRRLCTCAFLMMAGPHPALLRRPKAPRRHLVHHRRGGLQALRER